MKTLKIFLVLSIVFSLCSCKTLTEMREVEDAVLVCAIGFDKSGDFMKISAEIAFKSDETSLVTAIAATPEECIKKVEKNIPEKLLFSHCGTVILSQSLTQKTSRLILDYLFLKEDFPLNCYVVSADNAQNVLKCETPSGEAVGYAISKLLLNKSENTDSRIFSLYKNQEIILPCFTSDQKVLIREAQKWKIN